MAPPLFWACMSELQSLPVCHGTVWSVANSYCSDVERIMRIPI